MTKKIQELLTPTIYIKVKSDLIKINTNLNMNYSMKFIHNPTIKSKIIIVFIRI